MEIPELHEDQPGDYSLEARTMDGNLKLGLDNYSLRELGWKADPLLDYAASLNLDAILFSDPDVFESLTNSALDAIRSKASGLGIEIQVGILSICPSSVIFESRRGAAEEQLRLAIRVARSLGSPILRCVLGQVRDRQSAGGIEARITETVEVLKHVRNEAIDAGVKIAVENHAGDMQSWELVALIEEAGIEFVGATMDAGNAPWALEDPAESLEILGPYALTTGIRDSALWGTEEGAMLQWTAMGEGDIDWVKYFKRFAEICPETPVLLETISNRRISIPFWSTEFWDAYRGARISEFMKFLALVKKGRPRAPHEQAQTSDVLRNKQPDPKAELERSVHFCREVLGLGRKPRPLN